MKNPPLPRPFDLVCLGRAAVDLYGEQIGGRLEDMQTFNKYLGGSPANTAVGLARDKRAVENLRDRGVIRRPQDLGIDPRLATRNLLAARSMRDLVNASGGLYQPPKRFRNW